MYLTQGRQSFLTLHINGGAVVPQGKHSQQAKFARTNSPVTGEKKNGYTEKCDKIFVYLHYFNFITIANQPILNDMFYG